MKTTLISAFTLLVVLSMLMIVTGCTTPPAAKTDPLLIGDYPNVVVLEGLRDNLVVAQPVITKSINGRPLAVAVPVRRTSWTGDIPIQYRFEFYDADMRPLEPMPDWQVMTMSQAQVLLRGNALDDTAANWRLVLRPAR